ncbi:septum formation inhibitor Maf [Mediterraneibacter sp. NSJ-55]|uniref:dTTP/UTP pyrophosphatase n=1 Tax=Mediterraneibacter hominis TaxID=2763054 RepID=A0A923RRG3_9FIRM|nr:Maf family protein [Mediterraneibacter hominis]MBC5689673.1 septum formation inhibitor Maf [Mediterraneibacter hominis]
MKKVILASSSPRRRELLAQIGIEFDVRVSEQEEIYYSTVPEEIVKELALLKAEHVAENMQEEERAGKVIIGADTVVVQDGRILGKPQGEKEAFRMLKELQGRSHEVYTGTALLYFEGKEKKTVNRAVKTNVYVHAMTEGEIQAYIASGEPLDKAGAYGIQGKFAAFIERIEGDYYNVVGLPVSLVYQCLKKWNLTG